MFLLPHQAHPYLHELFKAVLLYDAPKAKKRLSQKIGGRLMNKWKLVKAYQEITPTPEKERFKKACDVIWILNRPEDKEVGYRRIVHEIKTGSYNVTDIVTVYKNLHFCSFRDGPRDSWRDECCWDNAGTTNMPICIWGWINKQIPPKDPLTLKMIKRGAVRLLPLDWITPILEDRMGEFLKCHREV